MIHPLRAERGAALFDALRAVGEADPDFIAALEAEQARLEALARQVTVLYRAGPAICEHYAERFTRLKDAGTPTGANDLWIACHALAEDATLVTHTTREFQRVEGLRVEDWVAPD